MDKRKAIRIITSAAKLYNQNLEDRKVCFVYGNPKVIDSQLQIPNSKIAGLSFYEVVFYRSNFSHLTGVKFSKNGSIKSTIDFYEKCLSNRLSEKDFTMSKDGSTDQKLEVLEQMMFIKSRVQMIGDFFDNGPRLYSEKVAGNICACIGFVTDSNTGLNVPNTLLNKDIRNVSNKPYQKVYAVFSKSFISQKYDTIEKCDKYFKLNNHILPEEIQSLLTDQCYS